MMAVRLLIGTVVPSRRIALGLVHTPLGLRYGEICLLAFKQEVDLPLDFPKDAP